MQMTTDRVTFACGDLTLEGLLHLPDAPKGRGIVVAHPHPLYGGDMHNGVVDAVCSTAVGAGLTALRFNFRGVGASGGKHDGGRGEVEDVLAALAFLEARPEVGSTPVLAGYSFGAMMALAAAKDAQIAGLLLVSPPLGTSEDAALPDAPVLIVSGSADQFAPAGALEAAASIKPNVTLRMVEGADHFWWGHEVAIDEATIAFVASLDG
jgi:alpha/beta superfamily hydrolase